MDDIIVANVVSDCNFGKVINQYLKVKRRLGSLMLRNRLLLLSVPADNH